MRKRIEQRGCLCHLDKRFVELAGKWVDDDWNLDKVWWNLQHLNNFLLHFFLWRFCKGGMKNQALIAKKFSQCMQFEIKLDGIQTLQQWRRRCSIVLKTFVLCAWIKENGNSTMKIDYNNVTLIRFRFHSYLDSSVTMRLLKALYSIKIPQDFQQRNGK